MLRVTLAALAFSTLAVAAQAAPFSDVPEVASVDVAYGDLNLSSPTDARVLAVRLQQAAHAVCTKSYSDSGTGPATMQNCINSAVSIALAHIEARLEGKVRVNLAYARP